MSFGVPRSPEVNEIIAADQLLKLLDATARRRCSRPHDTIYGVLGLCNYVRRQPLAEILKPNYGIPYSDVCRQYSAYLPHLYSPSQNYCQEARRLPDGGWYSKPYCEVIILAT